jgi:hypothetical protein
MTRWATVIAVYVVAALVGLLIANDDQNNVGTLYALVAIASVIVGVVTRNPLAALVAAVLIPMALPFGDTDKFTGGDDTDSLTLLAAIAAIGSAILILGTTALCRLYDRRQTNRERTV